MKRVIACLLVLGGISFLVSGCGPKEKAPEVKAVEKVAAQPAMPAPVEAAMPAMEEPAMPVDEGVEQPAMPVDEEAVAPTGMPKVPPVPAVPPPPPPAPMPPKDHPAH